VKAPRLKLGVPTYIYHFGDFDPSGVNAGEKIEQTLREMAPEAEIHFKRTAVTPEQIRQWSLPTRPTKKTDTAAFAVCVRHFEISKQSRIRVKAHVLRTAFAGSELLRYRFAEVRRNRDKKDGVPGRIANLAADRLEKSAKGKSRLWIRHCQRIRTVYHESGRGHSQPYHSLRDQEGLQRENGALPFYGLNHCRSLGAFAT
jgi:hypothetical protein